MPGSGTNGVSARASIDARVDLRRREGSPPHAAGRSAVGLWGRCPGGRRRGPGRAGRPRCGHTAQRYLHALATGNARAACLVLSRKGRIDADGSGSLRACERELDKPLGRSATPASSTLTSTTRKTRTSMSAIRCPWVWGAVSPCTFTGLRQLLDARSPKNGVVAGKTLVGRVEAWLLGGIGETRTPYCGGRFWRAPDGFTPLLAGFYPTPDGRLRKRRVRSAASRGAD